MNSNWYLINFPKKPVFNIVEPIRNENEIDPNATPIKLSMKTIFFELFFTLLWSRTFWVIWKCVSFLSYILRWIVFYLLEFLTWHYLINFIFLWARFFQHLKFDLFNSCFIWGWFFNWIILFLNFCNGLLLLRAMLLLQLYLLLFHLRLNTDWFWVFATDTLNIWQWFLRWVFIMGKFHADLIWFFLLWRFNWIVLSQVWIVIVAVWNLW